ncbi:MAG: hypothetical protein V2J55_08165 [Candidatus Competibacteraceae bacterium]|jgi:hypothetical protein|nr:hypothetical protein [Candidatus Competibacteraceae bacterium]
MLHPDLIEDRVNPDGEIAKRNKMKIYMDEAKARQTTHWDLDYLTTAEIDALMIRNKRVNSSTNVTRPSWLHQKLDLALLALALGGGLWIGFLMF